MTDTGICYVVVLWQFCLFFIKACLRLPHLPTFTRGAFLSLTIERSRRGLGEPSRLHDGLSAANAGLRGGLGRVTCVQARGK